jgi:hypothetical protein
MVVPRLRSAAPVPTSPEHPIVFTVDQREQIRTDLITRAQRDPRIVAAAVVGSSAIGGDRWSDLDLTFAVDIDHPLTSVIADWTGVMTTTYRAAVLFDINAGSTIYRVFLLPGALQIDLSFGPAGEWGAYGPRFHLLYGEAITRPAPQPVPTAHHLGYAVHHLVRAHICIARGRLWQAEHWLSEARGIAMTLACREAGLDEGYGRGFDQLPIEVQDRYRSMLPNALTASELRRALILTANAVLDEADQHMVMTPALRSLLAPILRGMAE